jgi:ferredoxin
MAVKVLLDRDLCQGHGMCVLEAPDVFALDKDDDQVRLLAEEPDESWREAVMKAVRYCPTAALSVQD